MNEQRVREIAEAAFKAHFGAVRVVRVNVRRGFDYDEDDPMADVNIIYDGKYEQLSGHGLLDVQSEIVSKVWWDVEDSPASRSYTSSPSPTSGGATRRRSDPKDWLCTIATSGTSPRPPDEPATRRREAEPKA